MDSILGREVWKRAGNLIFEGSLSLKLVQLPPSPKGAKTPNPNVHLSFKVALMYVLGTNSTCGLMKPGNPPEGMMVPCGTLDGVKLKLPCTNRPSISMRKPGWNAIPAGL